MLMIITALYCEAQPFIDHYQLKKNKEQCKFQVFENDEILLLITEPGSITAAVGVTNLCTLYQLTPSDFLVNIGVCAAEPEEVLEGSIFLCNQILEKSTGRSFYPDVVYRHPFAESRLITVSSVNHPIEAESLYDMEAAAVYQAASYFIQPHQISFIKVVSDHGVDTPESGNRMNPGKITNLINQNLDTIITYLEQLRQAGHKDPPIFNPEEELAIKNLSDSLHCSITMELKLRQQLHYYKLAHGTIREVIDDFCSEIPLPCKSKKEGIQYLEQFRARII